MSHKNGGKLDKQLQSEFIYWAHMPQQKKKKTNGGSLNNCVKEIDLSSDEIDCSVDFCPASCVRATRGFRSEH